MRVIEIIEQWLNKNGYDGLYTDNCSCESNDLSPCGCERVQDCKPGYKILRPGPGASWSEGDCPWHIGEKKPEVKNEIS